MKLFPYVLVRVGGGPFEKLEGIVNGTRTAELLHRIKKEEQKMNAVKQALSDELYKVINSLSDPRSQNLLLNLRRDVFNGKKVNPAKVNPFLPADAARQLEEFTVIYDTISVLRAEQEVVFNEELAEARKQLKLLASDEELQKGLLLSSRTLLDRVQAYNEADLSAPKKKEQQTELGLLKYITRMYTKTSPFSTFTNLVIAKVAEGQDRFIQAPAEAHTITSHIRINNFLFQYLRVLLLKNRDTYSWFPLRPNPTLKKFDDHYLFLTNSHNIEAFQRTPLDPLQELFCELTSERTEGVLYNDLVATIIENEYIDATAADIQDYIDKLVEFGFLEFNIGVSGIDPDWDVKFTEKLLPLAEKNVPHVQELVDVLREMRVMAGEYGQAGLGERKAILDKVHKRFRDICMKLHEAAGLPADERKTREEMMADYYRKQKEQKKKESENKDTQEAKEPEKTEKTGTEEEKTEGEKEEEAFRHITSTFFNFKPEQVFYEDTTRDVTPLLDEKRLEDLIQVLNELLQQMTLFQGFAAEKETMNHYFVSKYGADAEISLLAFYEDYYREYKKPEKERLEKLKKEAMEKLKQARENGEDTSVAIKINTSDEGPSIPAVKERSEQNKKWVEQFAANVRSRNPGDPIHLQLSDVTHANREAGFEPGAETSSSYGSFLQLYLARDASGNEMLNGVLNGTFPGFGKMLSRFLHIFDTEVTEELRRWNISMSGDELFVEDCDASYFNANLHPPLLPFEVWMPGGHNSLPPDKQLPITDFIVKHNTAVNNLDLIHTPSQKKAFVFDLGFQGHNGRSQLFLLLEKFARTRYLFATPLASSLTSGNNKEKLQKPDEVLRVPRIVYANRLVLQRRGWYLPKQTIPQRGPTETACSYYNRLNTWRQEQEIPDEVFVFINPDRHSSPAAGPEAKKQAGRDDYKPQYINFNSPLLVNLFEKLAGKIAHTLKVEEMMPSPGDLLHIGSSRHVTEFMVQWYNYVPEAGAKQIKEEFARVNDEG